MNSFKCVREFQIELEFGSVGFWGEGKTGVPGEKPSGTNERTNNKLNPDMASTPGFEPGPHWWEESASHHCATLAPQRAYSGLFFAWNSTTPDFIEYNRKTFISLSSLQSCIIINNVPITWYTRHICAGDLIRHRVGTDTMFTKGA